MAEDSIGRDIAAAINGHLKALRCLKRKQTTIYDVAQALELPEPIVERAFGLFRISAARIDPKLKVGKVLHTSPVIRLGRR